MKNILLIGGNGFIGKNIQEQWKGQYNIIAPTIRLKDPFLHHLIVSHQVDTVIHLASGLIPASNKADFYKEMKEVVIPTYELIDYCAANRIRFVFFSTGGCIYAKDHIFFSYTFARLSEFSHLHPITLYGLMKLLIEQYIRFIAETRGLDYVIIRPSNAFGKYQPYRLSQGFVTLAIHRIINGEKITVFGSGKQTRDYIEVTDLVTALQKVLLSKEMEICVNIGSGVGYSVLQVISILEKQLRKNAQIEFVGAREVDVDRTVLNVEYLKNLTGFTPRPFEESINDYIELFL